MQKSIIRIGETFYDSKHLLAMVDVLASTKTPLAKNMLIKLCNESDRIAGYCWGKDYISDWIFENIARKAVKTWSI